MSYRSRTENLRTKKKKSFWNADNAPFPSERQRMFRSMALLVVALVLLVLVFIRVIYIKVVHGEEYQYRAEQQQLSSTDVVIPSLRGSIYDRDGNVLAESVRVYNVILDPQALIDAGLVGCIFVALVDIVTLAGAIIYLLAPHPIRSRQP